MLPADPADRSDTLISERDLEERVRAHHGVARDLAARRPGEPVSDHMAVQAGGLAALAASAGLMRFPSRLRAGADNRQLGAHAARLARSVRVARLARAGAEGRHGLGAL